MYHFEMYSDDDGLYRWRFKDSDGIVLAQSAQGYTERNECLSVIDRIKIEAPGAPLD